MLHFLHFFVLLWQHLDILCSLLWSFILFVLCGVVIMAGVLFAISIYFKIRLERKEREEESAMIREESSTPPTKPCEPRRKESASLKYVTQNMPSQVGKTAIVTGGNRGIGYQAVMELYRAGCTVIVAARDKKQTEKAITEIRQQVSEEKRNSFWRCFSLRVARFLCPGTFQDMFQLEESVQPGSIYHVSLDLSSAKNTLDFCRRYRHIFGKRPLDILICNAGQFKLSGGVTQDGYNDLFQCNYLGHYLILMNLMDLIKASDDARVVFLSSELDDKLCGGIFTDSEVLMQSYSNRADLYGNSKFCNAALALFFCRKLRKECPSIRFNIVNPGFVRTAIFITNNFKGWFAGGFFERYIFPFMQPTALTPAQGAQAAVYLATSEDVVEYDLNGRYYEPRLRVKRRLDERMTDHQLQRRLFLASHKYVSRVLGNENYVSLPCLRDLLIKDTPEAGDAIRLITCKTPVPMSPGMQKLRKRFNAYCEEDCAIDAPAEGSPTKIASVQTPSLRRSALEFRSVSPSIDASKNHRKIIEGFRPIPATESGPSAFQQKA